MMIPFEQVPQWEKDTKFEITGEQFDKLSNIYGNVHKIMNEIFQNNMNLGNITVKYFDENGNEITKEQVEQMMKKAENIPN